jgi:hypothetical protein
LKMHYFLYIQNLSFFWKNYIIRIICEILPQRGSGCCSGRCNRKTNPNLSCYRRVMYIAVVCHNYFSKVHFFIKKQNLLFCFYEYFTKYSLKKRILIVLLTKDWFLILIYRI